MVDVTQFLKLLDPLLVLVTQTTPVIDGAAKGMSVYFYSLCLCWIQINYLVSVHLKTFSYQFFVSKLAYSIVYVLFF